MARREGGKLDIRKGQGVSKIAFEMEPDLRILDGHGRREMRPGCIGAGACGLAGADCPSPFRETRIDAGD